MSDYDKIDMQALLTIRDVRSEHGACTARRVAQILRVSPDVIRHRMDALRDRALVWWSDVPGSLQLTDDGERIVNDPPAASSETEAQTTDEAEQPSTPPPAKRKRASKKTAAKSR